MIKQLLLIRQTRSQFLREVRNEIYVSGSVVKFDRFSAWRLRPPDACPVLSIGWHHLLGFGLLLFIGCLKSASGQGAFIEITLVWTDRSRIEEAYHVERRESSATEYVRLNTAPLPANTTSFVDDKVAEGKEYVYRVVAANEYGESSSGPLYVQVQPPEVEPEQNNLVARSGPRPSEFLPDGIDWRKEPPKSNNQKLLPDGKITPLNPSLGLPEFEYSGLKKTTGEALVFLDGYIGEAVRAVSLTRYIVTPNFFRLEANTGGLLDDLRRFHDQSDDSVSDPGDGFAWSGNDTSLLPSWPPAFQQADGDRLTASDTLNGWPSIGSFYLHIAEDGSISFFGLGESGAVMIRSPEASLGTDGRIQVDGNLWNLLIGQFGTDSLVGASLRFISPFSGSSFPVEEQVSKFVGIYEGVVAGTSAGRVQVVVGPDGLAEVRYRNQGRVYTDWAKVGPNGKIRLGIGGRLELDLELKPKRNTAVPLSAGVHNQVPSTGGINGTVDSNGKVFGVLPHGAAVTTPSRIVNLSIRSDLEESTDQVILGFVVAGFGTNGVMVRGVGPTLKQFAVVNALDDPIVRVTGTVEGEMVIIGTNNDWEDWPLTGWETILGQVGAFSFASGSKDSAMVVDLQPGVYTAVISASEGNPSGSVLTELYETSTVGAEGGSYLGNISSRVSLPQGGTATLGFVLRGESASRVLVRAVGPTLGSFGVPDSLGNPRLRILAGSGQVMTELAQNDDWMDSQPDDIRLAVQRVGAFPLGEGSRDSAYVAWLAPAVYQIQVTGGGEPDGVVLIELYVVD